MLFLVGYQIIRLGTVLDFAGGIIKAPPELSSPVQRKIYLGGGPYLRPSGVITFDLHAMTGLEKAKGVVYRYNERASGIESMIIAMEESHSQKNDRGRLAVEKRQNTIESFAHDRRPLARQELSGKETDLYRFSNIYWFNTTESNISEMEKSWDQVISSRDYFLGLKGPQQSIAAIFTFACAEFSDTPEVQMTLSKSMIERDPTNPIAWWYLCHLDNTSLSARMPLDWRKQQKVILRRMGNWKIGKDYLSKRFAQSQ